MSYRSTEAPVLSKAKEPAVLTQVSLIRSTRGDECILFVTWELSESLDDDWCLWKQQRPGPILTRFSPHPPTRLESPKNKWWVTGGSPQNSKSTREARATEIHGKRRGRPLRSGVMITGGLERYRCKQWLTTSIPLFQTTHRAGA